MAINPLQFLLDQRAPDKETEWLSALAPPQAPIPENPYADATVDAAEAPPPATKEASPVAAQSTAARLPSRQEMLLAALQRPTREDGVKAALFDGLFGGSQYSDDLKARRNMFDQAMIGAQAADAGAAERALESEASRGMQREQFELTRRGQNLADQRAEEQRKLQLLLLGQRLGATSTEKEKDRTAALERAKVSAHGKGSGAPASPEARAEREASVNEMEASYLAGAASVPGQKAVTIDQAKAFQANPAATPEELGVTPEQLEVLRRSRATLSGLKVTDGKAYAQLIKGGEARETGTGDAIGKGIVSKEMDPIRMGKAREEMLEISIPLNDAINSWKTLGDDAKKILVRYGGAGESQLLAALKTASLSPEEQVAAARIQRLVNVDIKKFSGSAVTGSEWSRQAQAIGLPSGDYDPWKSPAVLHDYLGKASRTYNAMRRNYEATHPDIFKGYGGQK